MPPCLGINRGLAWALTVTIIARLRRHFQPTNAHNNHEYRRQFHCGKSLTEHDLPDDAGGGYLGLVSGSRSGSGFGFSSGFRLRVNRLGVRTPTAHHML